MFGQYLDAPISARKTSPRWKSPLERACGGASTPCRAITSSPSAWGIWLFAARAASHDVDIIIAHADELREMECYKLVFTRDGTRGRPGAMAPPWWKNLVNTPCYSMDIGPKFTENYLYGPLQLGYYAFGPP